uniref:RRM domain-containing protein n=1 Tax=Clastoptera arizonana TaxID=38151 RepID=A0A1B6D106_9HEMI
MGEHNESRGKLDDPPNSRLFIVCHRQLTENDFRQAFEKFGTIEEVWIVKDRNTKEAKGVVYIKFSKTSEAALALEEMNGKTIAENTRPLKVMIAHNRDQGSKREENENDRLLRLFIVVPKSMTEDELRTIFMKFGELDHVAIVKHRESRESKGFAYVKYVKMSHAAKAFEECDRSFKAVFARPKEHKPIRDRDRDMPPSYNGYNDTFDRFSGPRPPFIDNYVGDGFHEGYTRLYALVSPQLSQDQTARLFDLIPGLEVCRFLSDPFGRGGGPSQRVLVRYETHQAASFAMEKLNGFEYPLGKRIIVKPDIEDIGEGSRMHGSVVPGKRDSMGFAAHNRRPLSVQAPQYTAEILSLTKALAAATDVIKAAGLRAPTTGIPQEGEGLYDPHYCSAKLPPSQPLAPNSIKTEERLFIVCQPGVPPMTALWDVFGRFGDLIDVYILNGKNCGYVSYGKKESANKAIEVLHGQDVCRMRLKVMLAEPPKGESRKRIKMDSE